MVFSFPVSPVTPPTRRAAPPARPHSFIGFRAQHHHYHQQLLRASPQQTASVGIRLSRLPDSVLCRVLQFVTPNEFARVASVSRRFRRLSEDDSIWDLKIRWLDYKGPTPSADFLVSPTSNTTSASLGDDELFGDFVVGSTTAPNRVALPLDRHTQPRMSLETSLTALQLKDTSRVISESGACPGKSVLSPPKEDSLMVFHARENDVGSLALDPGHPQPLQVTSSAARSQPLNSRQRFIQQYVVLMPYLNSLYHHTTSSLLFTDPNLTSRHRVELLSTLFRLLSNPFLAPSRFFANPVLARNIQSAIDVFEASLLSEFEHADDRGDEDAMRTASELVWALGCDGSSVIQVFITKREIFYDTRFNPLDNLVRTETQNGQMADGVDFRPMETYMRHVLETITREGSLIARVFPPDATVLLHFIERIAVDVLSEYITTLLSSAQSLPQPLFQLSTVAVYSQLRAAIETTMAIKPPNKRVTLSAVEDIFNKMFEIHLSDYLQEEADWTKEVLERLCAEWGPPVGVEPTTDAAALKRNVLGSLKDALMVPVSVVPKTVAYSFNALSTVGAGAFQSVAGGLKTPALPGSMSSPATASGYKDAQFLVDGRVRGNELESWLDENEDAEVGDHQPPQNIALDPALESTSGSVRDEVNDLRLLLSLDVSLKLIAADREALKRVETFESFKGFYGSKIPDIASSSDKSKKLLKQNKSGELLALVEYFELVQIADTIQQMVEAYYEAEMVQKIDRTDFLNAIVREKRAFEMGLDDGVAGGLNASLGLLMSEVERVMSEAQTGVDYCPDAVLVGHSAENPTSSDVRGRDLEPTAACRAALDCLDRHCGLLQSSRGADKQIMEVFYQEVGLRLHGMICKHLKRLIISVEGGFQLIADLNAYHQFVSKSFRSVDLSAEFASLKLLGSLFIIESPKLLAELARDVERFGGTFRVEDIYEFIKRRSDWKKIEKEVDRAMFGIGQDDCLVS
ncbi:uncharacterized protein MELLADRAFT_87530 [Melampsora larici-populina 98AG31]|uniref:F-box domain-containing protein n=1 Tax=Melampsora larici-populina (strain 98AG31 / pathotype 3-4-7) TaxID=747676 RepID=F4RNN7_MELLP|nr:uncharacterized protein MELLADRAFT_87530 [Melampsora larici-populina 98AG31]EGG06017.1 hypothetical protein MELLADRAFT_87530 [Melampsora larici-populina 98AG31]